MNKFQKKCLIGLTVLGLGAAAMTVQAENNEGDHRGGAPTVERGEHGEHGGGRFAARMRERMQRHQQHLHDQLKLSAAQEADWQTFIASMKPSPEALREHAQHVGDHAAMEKLSAPARMEKMLERMKEGESHMAARLAALKKFYASLSDDQKKTFDENAGPRHHRGDFRK